MLATIEEALGALREGRMIILVDDEDRENEGDIVAAASAITAEQVAFMAKQARGLICLTLEAARCDELGLDPMTPRNNAPLGTAFTVSIDAREGVSTGVSAADRARTMRRAVDPATTSRDFVSPGSVFPLRAVPGGVLSRTGQTEGSVDLARLAGLPPAGVICEVLREDGTMMRLAELREFGARFGLPVAAVADLVAYRLRTEKLVERVAVSDLPTDFGDFRVHAFRSAVDDRTHLALVAGDVSADEPALVRVHRASFPGDTFAFGDDKGRAGFEGALAAVAASGRGVFLYLNREETGVELLETLARQSADSDPSTLLVRAVAAESPGAGRAPPARADQHPPPLHRAGRLRPGRRGDGPSSPGAAAPRPCGLTGPPRGGMRPLFPVALAEYHPLRLHLRRRAHAPVRAPAPARGLARAFAPGVLRGEEGRRRRRRRAALALHRRRGRPRGRGARPGAARARRAGGPGGRARLAEGHPRRPAAAGRGDVQPADGRRR
ncbi:MAG: 3,4-dihydroxy-2-butanone-4-phosphate synthase [Deltaproteobacteria bacterium]|nr:3,4-dihydroxy-2-butanone-4-phosphate synthase [Deltaproteobacteria bacterium]